MGFKSAKLQLRGMLLFKYHFIVIWTPIWSTGLESFGAPAGVKELQINLHSPLNPSTLQLVSNHLLCRSLLQGSIVSSWATPFVPSDNKKQSDHSYKIKHNVRHTWLGRQNSKLKQVNIVWFTASSESRLPNAMLSLQHATVLDVFCQICLSKCSKFFN